MPAVLVEIIVTNLIRNTFQHASKGDVEIRISPRGISISNALYELGQERLSQDSLKQSDSEVSFGIGLILIERLCSIRTGTLPIKLNRNRFFSKVDFSY